ncbi:PxKF domain-containing protein [Candidatus Bathyarchaeota archaeon]|nr:PxKF domain-containing protein [Candidatus Bathyarchaeota archaeon]
MLQPIKPDGTRVFKLGSTIPVKFKLWDADGNPITDATASISLDEVISGIPVGEPEEGGSTSAATEGNLFRYDDTDNQYIFNLATKTLSRGTWEITITVNGTGSFSVNIGLK